MDISPSSSWTPQWLSKDYFQLLVNRKYPEAIVKKVTLSRDSDKSIDLLHVFSCVVELVTSVGSEQKRYLVKTCLYDLDIDNAGTRGLQTEARVLTKIVPMMERLLQSLAMPDPMASALVEQDEVHHCNVIEDDSDAGFHTFPQTEGVDLKHCMAFMRHLALFHASSIPALEDLPPDVLDFPVLPESDTLEFNEAAIKASLSAIVDEVESWEDGTQWVEKVRKVNAALPTAFAAALRRRPESLRVLVHGAPSTDCVLFRGETRVRLRGFEHARLGSFADDVLHFLFHSAADAVLEAHTDLLAEEYRVALNAALAALGRPGDRLSAEALRRELHAQRAVALVAAFHGLLRARTPGHTRAVVHRGPEYSRLLRTLLSLLDAKGWLDGFDETPAENHIVIRPAPAS